MGLQVFEVQVCAKAETRGLNHMDALRKQIQSLADFVLNHCFWTYAMLRNFENDRKKQFSLEVVFGLL